MSADTLTRAGQAETQRPALIVRPPLKELVFQAIEDAIMREELRPGQRLTEVGLARKLGVGQATVREALIQLEVKGFIQRRHRNKYVTVLSSSDIDAIYAVRIPLEKLAVDWLALRQDKHLEKLEKAHATMVATSRGGDLSRFKEADYAFHSALWAATGNRYLQDVLERLVPQLFAFAIANIRQSHSSREILQQLADLHGKILRGIQAGDVQAAQEALEASMDRTWIVGLERPGKPSPQEAR
jgi:DNA-binding GntR family transcriptional regulator